jgi:RNA 2',3'-cyclic 3'-phosphodiesterase
MRLFTGIDLPDHVVNVFERLLARFRPAAHLKWVPAYNMHITARFIGEWPETRLDELKDALAEVAPRAGFCIDLRGLGWFPNPRKPRVFWAGVEAGGELRQLARDIDAALERLGLPAEVDREFSPHLTLARIKQPVPLDKLHEMVAKIETSEIASFTASHFNLYRSQPGAAGSIYTKLCEFRFAEVGASVQPSFAG